MEITKTEFTTSKQEIFKLDTEHLIYLLYDTKNTATTQALTFYNCFKHK